MITGRLVLRTRDQLQATWDQSPGARVFAIALLAAFAVMLLSDAVGDDAGDELLLFSPLLIAGLWLGLIAIAVRRMSPQQRQVGYLIDEERIVIRDAAGNAQSSPWREIRACEERRSGFALRIGPGARWVAKRAFARADLAAFRALARKQLGDKARVGA